MLQTLIRSRSFIMGGICCLVGVALLAQFALGWAGASTAGSDMSAVASGAADGGEGDQGQADVPPTDPPIVVYISGAVVSPDVYQLPAAARVNDALLASGGPTDAADLEAVNLAAPLKDGQHLTIPAHGTDTVAPPAAAAGPAARGPLDINGASAADLTELPGIGDAVAGRIVAYRQEHGPFASVDELGEVKGIGPAILEKIAPLVAVQP